jgi:hypothetical protein
MSSLKKEFKFCLQQQPAELSTEKEEDEPILRFNFARAIFLERGL